MIIKIMKRKRKDTALRPTKKNQKKGGGGTRNGETEGGKKVGGESGREGEAM